MNDPQKPADRTAGPNAGSGISGAPDFAAVREDFPRARTLAYFDNASSHPISVQSAAALHRYVDWLTHDIGGDSWWPSWAQDGDDATQLFARLINAAPEEISFARSTVEAENNLLNGMADHLAGGNVVTSDLHYNASLFSYKVRQRAGLDVRIVKHRDWQMDVGDIERAIDDDTRLVSLALVSNVNGYLADVKAIADLAHARGAYLYADIIQAAGAVPIDVRAMGIDMAACSTFKWLMGVKGFGFLFVRQDLQGTVVKPSQPFGGVTLNYAPWVDHPDPNAEDISAGSGRPVYHVSYPSYEGRVSARESLRYILRLGVHNIRDHARDLTDRLHRELPARGYAAITPAGNESPIVAFTVPDPEATLRRMHEAGVLVALRFGNKMRISPSVYNNHEDVDRLVAALP